MANKRKPNTTRKASSTTRNSTARSRAKSQTVKTKKRSAEIKGITLIALGIFMALSFFGSATGIVGETFKNVLMGLFGGAAVMFFVFIVWTGINMFLEKKRENSGYKLWILLGLMVVTSVIWAIWYEDTTWEYPDFWKGIRTMYAWGSDGGSGGVIGISLCILLVKCLGKVGTAIISIAAAMILLLILTEVSLEKMFKAISAYIKRNKAEMESALDEDVDMEIEEREAKPRKLGRKKIKTRLAEESGQEAAKAPNSD